MGCMKPASTPAQLLESKQVDVVACDGDLHRDERLVTSSDGGKTWKVAAGDMRRF